MGIAIRSGSPLSLSVAEPVWKQLAGMPLSISDLTEMDKDFVPGQPLSFFLRPSSGGHLGRSKQLVMTTNIHTVWHQLVGASSSLARKFFASLVLRV